MNGAETHILGYEVKKVKSIEEAQEVLHNVKIHCAIIDLRLKNDSDENDFSSIKLAEDPSFCTIPKVILTGYPSVLAVKGVFSQSVNGFKVATNFMCKKEDPDAMIHAIKEVV
jgi:ActR/RegA family two-component response regulator